MVERKYFLVQISGESAFSHYVTGSEVARRCHLHPDLLERLVNLGLIDYVDRDVNGEAIFHMEVIPLVRRIMRLRNQLGVNYAGIGVILELMDRIETLENHIRELEDGMLGYG
jgi:DNA-binding transcriptional MerR regulator